MFKLDPLSVAVAALLSTPPSVDAGSITLRDAETQASVASATTSLLSVPPYLIAGAAGNGGVLLRGDCADFTPGLYASCVTMPAGQTVPFDARDLGSLDLPARLSRTLICPLVSNRYTYNLMNSTTNTENGGSVSFDPYYTIESEVLNDASAIDPSTGLPYGGTLDISASAPFAHGTNNLRPGLPESETGYVSRSCIGGWTAEFFESSYGLPAALARKLVYGAMTIRLNVRGEATNLRDGAYLFGVRMVTD